MPLKSYKALSKLKMLKNAKLQHGGTANKPCLMPYILESPLRADIKL